MNFLLFVFLCTISLNAFNCFTRVFDKKMPEDASCKVYQFFDKTLTKYQSQVSCFTRCFLSILLFIPVWIISIHLIFYRIFLYLNNSIASEKCVYPFFCFSPEPTYINSKKLLTLAVLSNIIPIFPILFLLEFIIANASHLST